MVPHMAAEVDRHTKAQLKVSGMIPVRRKPAASMGAMKAIHAKAGGEYGSDGTESCKSRQVRQMKSISQIKEDFEAVTADTADQFIAVYAGDERSGVQTLVKRAQKKKEALAAELERLEKMRIYEHRYDDFDYICGIDEAGRGPLAGPVAAGAVILPKGAAILYVNDSKKLSAKRRDELYDEIMAQAISAKVGIISNEVIDEINILQATYEAMRQAVSGLTVQPQVLLNDAVVIPGIDLPQEKIIKGDAKSISIAAASIIAKVTRDRMMDAYDELYPEYGFAKHKGYGTAEHIAAIRKYGPCPIHRMTFIQNFLV